MHTVPIPCCRLVAGITLALATATPALAASWLDDGKLLFDARLRHEQVDDDALAEDADALTLRTRLGWRSGAVNGFYGVVEVEDVRALVDDYNSTANGRTQYPVVADPEDTEWNQVFLGWDSGSGTQLAIGRQRLMFDNQRHIGNVGWRQNEQTFDAFSGSHAFGEALTLRYAWLDQVNRVFGDSHPNPLQAAHDLDGHLLNLGWASAVGLLTGYGYFVENEDLPATSTRSLGLRLAGARKHGEIEWLYTAELARQQGWRDAPSTGDVDYLFVEAGLRIAGHAVKIANEQLGSNGRRAYQTPLATGHAFNGWADRFLVTPADGLDDRYISVDGPVGPLRYVAAWHDYRAERGRADYGDELDLQLAWPFRAGWNAIAKFADYRSDGFASDQRKLWLSVEYRY